MSARELTGQIFKLLRNNGSSPDSDDAEIVRRARTFILEHAGGTPLAAATATVPVLEDLIHSERNAALRASMARLLAALLDDCVPPPADFASHFAADFHAPAPASGTDIRAHGNAVLLSLAADPQEQVAAAAAAALLNAAEKDNLPELRERLSALKAPLAARAATDYAAATALLRLGGGAQAAAWLKARTAGGTIPVSEAVLAQALIAEPVAEAAEPLAQLITQHPLVRSDAAATKAVKAAQTSTLIGSPELAELSTLLCALASVSCPAACDQLAKCPAPVRPALMAALRSYIAAIFLAAAAPEWPALRQRFAAARPLFVAPPNDSDMARSCIRIEGPQTALPWLENLAQGAATPLSLTEIAQELSFQPEPAALTYLLNAFTSRVEEISRDPVLLDWRVSELRPIFSAIQAIDPTKAAQLLSGLTKSIRDAISGEYRVS